MLKLFRITQPPHGAHADLVRLVGRRGRLSHLSGSYLDVLLAQRGCYVTGGKAAGREPHRIKPQAHGIFALTKDDYVAHALYTLDGIAHVKIKVVADKKIVVFLVVGIKAVGHHKRASILVDAYARRLH